MIGSEANAVAPEPAPDDSEMPGTRSSAAEIAPGADPTPGHRPRRRWNLSAMVGSVLLAFIGLLGAVSLLTGTDTDARGPSRLAGPSLEHWAGTDRLGRDLFAQIMSGAVSAVIIVLGSIAIAALLGVTLGILAAGTKRWIDNALVGLIDLLIAFPMLLLAMVIVTVRGASTSAAIAAIGISGSAIIARVTRINAAKAMGEDYVVAATATGVGWWGIQLRHVLPNIAATLGVQLALLGGTALLAESALSYLGLGTPPPQASWGRMLREAQATMSVEPWGAILPGLAIVITVLGINLLADGLRERLDHPSGIGARP